MKNTVHPIGSLMEKLFMLKEGRGNKFFNGVQTLSIRLLIKIMTQYLTDKGTSAIDSTVIRNQHLSEFIYDQNFNKFGIVKLTEKKFKEIVFTIEKNKARIPKCEFYARLMGISDEINYSNDDLTFLFRSNKILSALNAFT
jgi:hypothetical protein